MPVKVNVGLSKKIGQPDYGSLGASCNVEFELDGSYDNGSSEHFQEAVRRAYVACRQAVESEIAVSHSPRNGIGGQHSATPVNRVANDQPSYQANGNGNVRNATSSQVRAIFAIANRSRVDLPSLLSQFGVSRPDDLVDSRRFYLDRPAQRHEQRFRHRGGAMIGLTNQAIAETNAKPVGIAGRDYISFSQLSTFRQCPLKYRFRYLDRLEPEFVSSSLLVGSSIHRAIEHHHRRQLESGKPATLDEMLEAFWDEWRCRVEESPEIRFGKNEDIGSIDDLAKRMLTSFIDSDLSKAPGVVIGIEESLRETVIEGRPEFLGIVDLVFESGDTLIIRDYKTSRSKWNQGTAESSAGQLLLYAELAKELLPGRHVEVEFAVLTKTKSPTLELFKIDADPQRLERTKRVAGRTLDAISTGVFYPNQSAMNCGGCPFRSACAAWKG